MGERDEFGDQAIALIQKHGWASTSLLQRHLRIGYARAWHLLEWLTDNGHLQPADTPHKPRTATTTEETR